MITELRLQNWKSFEDATLFIDPLSVLIGTNASGKSNVLDALFFLQRMISGINLTTILEGGDPFEPALRGGLKWVVLKPNSRFTLGISFEKDRHTTYEYSITCDVINDSCRIFKELLISNKEGKQLELFSAKQDSSISSTFIVTSELLPNKWRLDNNKTALILFSGLFLPDDSSPEQKEIYSGIDELFNTLKKSILIIHPSPREMASIVEIGGWRKNILSYSAHNLAGVLTNLPVKKQKKIEDTLTQYLSRLPERDIGRFYAAKVDKLGDYARLYCDEKWKETGKAVTVDARVMSDGTLHFIAILTALLIVPEGSLLAIDEVDKGLHPSRAKLLLEALQNIGKQRNIDVLVTTHNPALLDAMGTRIVPFVTLAHRDVTTGNSRLTLLEDIKQLPKLLAQGLVGKLSTQGLLEKSLETNDE